MNGIKMSECKFYVNEPKRTIVCVIPDVVHHSDGTKTYTHAMLRNFLTQNCRFNDVNFVYTDKGFDMLELPRSFSGKAVCAPEDKWDEELGKKIAFSRAKAKLYTSFFKRANKFVQATDNRLGEMIDIFNTFGEKLDDKRRMLEKEISFAADQTEE